MKNKLLKLHRRLLRSKDMLGCSGLCMVLLCEQDRIGHRTGGLFRSGMGPGWHRSGTFWGAPSNSPKWIGVYTELRQNLLILFAYAYEDLKE